jgi:hypothetical protein
VTVATSIFHLSPERSAVDPWHTPRTIERQRWIPSVRLYPLAAIQQRPIGKRAWSRDFGDLSMRIAILIAIGALLAFVGEWIYRGFIRPVDPVPPEMLALAGHFDRSGIKVRPYAVQHNFRHSQVLAVAAFEIAGFPLPIGFVLCPTEQSATERFEAGKHNPSLLATARNGRLVMQLPMWGDGTEDMAAKVERVFASFDGST